MYLGSSVSSSRMNRRKWVLPKSLKYEVRVRWNTCLLRQDTFVLQTMKAEELLIRFSEVLNKYNPRNDSLSSIFQRDDVDMLMDVVSKKQISPSEYTNAYDQGLLHLAGMNGFEYIIWSSV